VKINNRGSMTVGKVIAVLIFVVIALALLPTFISSVNSGRNATNTSSYQMSRGLLPLITVFVVLGILVAVAVWLVREAGYLGGG